MTKKSILDEFVLVTINFSHYSGKISLSRLGAEGEQFCARNTAPESIVSGQLKTVPESYIKGFCSLKSKANNFLKGYGVPLQGGWAIPVRLYPKVKGKLDEITEEFRSDAEDFSFEFSEIVQKERYNAWKRGSSQSLLNLFNKVLKVHTSKWIWGRFSASYAAMQLKALPQEEEELEAQVQESLQESLLKEVAALAGEALRPHEKSASKITRKLVTGTLNKISAKMEALIFISPMFGEILNTLEVFIKELNMPLTGNLTSQNQKQLRMLLALMSEVETLERLPELLLVHEAEVAEVEAIEVAEVEAIEVAEVEAIEVAEVEAIEVAEVEAIEVAEVEAIEVAEVEAIEVAEVEAIEVAEVEAIEVAEVEAIEVAEVEAIEVAEVEAIEVAAFPSWEEFEEEEFELLL